MTLPRGARRVQGVRGVWRAVTNCDRIKTNCPLPSQRMLNLGILFCAPWHSADCCTCFMNILLFEDDRVGQLAPITLGRPAYAVTCGSFRLIVVARGLGPLRR